MTVTISEPLVGDMPAVLEMIAALAAFHGDASAATLETLQDAQAHQTRFVVAKQGGVCVGYAALLPLAQLQFGVRGLDMHHLFVREGVRGQGVGHALIAACVQITKDKGARYLTVGTLEGNVAAQALYRAAGFEDLPASGPRFAMRV